MDIIQQCLFAAPVPYLAQAFSVFRFIWLSVEQAQASKWQLEALAQSIAQLLHTLNREYLARRLLQVRTSAPLTDLYRFVRWVMPRQYVFIYISIRQAIGRDLSFRSERNFVLISKATVHQRSKNCSDRGLLPTHWHLGPIVSGKRYL